ncbi:SurA N-terminal domain-containing protein [Thermomonas carbonis]|uniref:Periplasmic chaperone PpiD n=1 Tax=Thermomonas carbonis TaxID=1463158 RepID=A0A7G9SMN4_9GAMM|nr:SurA N-terminal domain-containing protein [Thermomonas carbonis]QNN69109.1 SurA N-terminal domain-containing protein [Thermomonas carbonis]GHC06684.1 peptidylprolyl isomerase [Thermomonas carbonis]
MLQTLRDKTSGWIATVILGLLIIPFAFFGMESYLTQKVDAYAARITQPPAWWPSAPQAWPVSYLWKTHDIDAQDYRQRLETMRMRLRDEQGDKFDSKAFESAENKRQILDDMIDEQLMRLAAESDGIVVSDAEIRQEIQQIPDFQVDGKFDADRYQLLLASQNPPQTPRTFEQTVRDNLQYGLIPSRLARSGFVTDMELDRLMRLLGERRDVSFVVMPPIPADTAPITPAQIQAWYEANARDYRSPETVRLEYVEVDASTLPVPVADEAALRKLYEEQAAKFSTAEQRSVSHILVQVAADASDADKQAAEARAKKLADQARVAGADFAALARANSDDAGSKAAGGSLGWLAKGGMPGPFDDAAFAMAAGEVRGPVKTDFGWHVIKLDELRGGTRQPFEAVRAQLEQELVEGGRERAFNELSGKLVDAVYKNPNSLEPAAKSLGLMVQTTPAFPRGGGPGIASDQKVLRAAFSDTLIRDGTASDPIELSPTRTVLIRVVEHKPEAALPLSQVGNAVVLAIRADRQRKAAEAAADTLVKAAKASGLPAAATAATLAMGEANDVRRGSAVPSPEVVEAFFRVPRPQDNLIPVGKTEAGGQFIVFAIRAVRDGDIGQVTAEERDQLRQQLSQASGFQAQKAFVRAARGKYQIKVAEDRL